MEILLVVPRDSSSRCSSCGGRSNSNAFRMGKMMIDIIWGKHVAVSYGETPPETSILDWDFPWNKPSSYWGTHMTMETTIGSNHWFSTFSTIPQVPGIAFWSGALEGK